mmetsp:Transcript_33755/g.34390  ORF Transcript_33755/g.34390 Transcript_33755/m.34390 type:complete len:170 (-) Transcript_33755:90-599(-)
MGMSVGFVGGVYGGGIGGVKVWKSADVCGKNFGGTTRNHRLSRSVIRCAANDDATKSDVGKDAATKAKDLVVKYGPAYLVTSSISSVVSISAWFLLVKSGLDIRHLLENLANFLAATPLGRPGILDKISDDVGTFALAYIAHKASSPIRFPLVVALVPYVARAINSIKK